MAKRTVGARLKELRGELKQTPVAKALGIEQGSYSDLENDVSKEMSGSTLARACQFYRVRAQWLMFEEGPKDATLSEDEWGVIDYYRKLSPSHRAALHVYLTGSTAQRDALFEAILRTTSQDGRTLRHLRSTLPPGRPRIPPKPTDS